MDSLFLSTSRKQVLMVTLRREGGLNEGGAEGRVIRNQREVEVNEKGREDEYSE